MNIKAVLKWRWLWGFVLWIATIAVLVDWATCLNDTEPNINWVAAYGLYIVGWFICAIHFMMYLYLESSQDEKKPADSKDKELSPADNIFAGLILSFAWPLNIFVWPMAFYVRVVEIEENEFSNTDTSYTESP